MRIAAKMSHGAMNRHVLLLVASHVLIYGAIGGFFILNGSHEPLALVLSAVLFAELIALSVIDFETLTLPHRLTLLLIVSGLIGALLQDSVLILERVLAAGGAFLFFVLVAHLYFRIRKQHGLGGGDAFLYAAAGAWLGPAGLAPVLLLSTSAALAAVILSYIRGKPPERNARYPFGPYLAFGLWLQWLLNQT